MQTLPLTSTLLNQKYTASTEHQGIQQPSCYLEMQDIRFSVSWLLNAVTNNCPYNDNQLLTSTTN